MIEEHYGSQGQILLKSNTKNSEEEMEKWYKLKDGRDVWLVLVDMGGHQNCFSEKVGHLAQQGAGGVWPKPKFLLKFSKTKFALVNGQKCDETHNT